MANQSTITVRILGNAQGAIQEIGKLDGAIGKLGKGALIAGGALGTVAVAAGGALFAIGEQFNSLENTIIKGTGATGDALEGLVNEAKDVLATVPESGDVVAGVLADVNTFFGQTGDTLEESSKLFLDFARVTGGDVNNAISGLDAAFTQFGESPQNLNEVLGDFTRISQATGAPVDKLIGQIETFGPIFANAGFSIEETTALFGQLEQAGVDVTRIGPALNKFFRDTAEAGEDPQLALQGVVDSIANAEDATEALNIASGAFGAEGAQRLTNAIRSGNFDLETFNGLLGEGAGLVGEQAEATESFGDKLNRLKNQTLVALAPAAEAVFDAISQAIDDLQPFIDQFGVWFAEQLPIWIENLQEFFERWGPVVSDVVAAVADAINDYLIPALRFLVDEVLPVVIEWVEENWPQIEEIIVAVLETVTLAFETASIIITTLWGIFGDYIIDVVQIIANTIVPVFLGALEIIQGVYKVFQGVFTGDWSLLWEGLTGIFTGAWSIVSSVITGAFNLLIATLGEILDGLVSIVTGTFDSVVGAVSGLGGRIADAAVGIFDGVKDAFRSAINFIIDGWNNLSFSVPSIGTPFGDFGGFNVGTPDIPRLATGAASFAPMLAIVGDNPQAYRDPEITAPQSFIRDAVRDVLAEFGGGPTQSTTTTIYAQGYSDTDALARDVDRAQRRRNLLTGNGLAFTGDLEAA